MKMSIVKEEWWPVLELQEPNNYDPVADAPEELVELYDAIMRAFGQLQQTIRTWAEREGVDLHS